MPTQKVLTLFLCFGLVTCKRGTLDVQKKSGSSKEPVALSLQEKSAQLKGRIPLDRLGEQGTSWLIKEHSSKADDEKAVTLSGTLGLERQFFLVPDEEGVTVNAPLEPREQFPGFAIVSEQSLFGFEEHPERRLFNLPDLLSRVALQAGIGGKQAQGLPPGVSIFPSSDTELTVVVTQPTVLAASFSVGRTVKIFNRSQLILIVPLAENVTLQQSPSLSTSEIPRTEIHSFSCVDLDLAGWQGTLQHFRLGTVDYGIQKTCESTLADPERGIAAAAPSALQLESWMPQVLITQRVRGENITETYARWARLIPFSALRFGQ